MRQTADILTACALDRGTLPWNLIAEPRLGSCLCMPHIWTLDAAAVLAVGRHGGRRCHAPTRARAAAHTRHDSHGEGTCRPCHGRNGAACARLSTPWSAEYGSPLLSESVSRSWQSSGGRLSSPVRVRVRSWQSSGGRLSTSVGVRSSLVALPPDSASQRRPYIFLGPYILVVSVDVYIYIYIYIYIYYIPGFALSFHKSKTM